MKQLKRFDFFDQLQSGLGAVRVLALIAGSDLSQSFGFAFWNENRVIAEAVLASRRFRDLAF